LVPRLDLNQHAREGNRFGVCFFLRKPRKKRMGAYLSAGRIDMPNIFGRVNCFSN
jgi:hypothetical protein